MKNTKAQSDHHYLLAVGGILAAVALIALVVINPGITGMAVEGYSESSGSGVGSSEVIGQGQSVETSGVGQGSSEVQVSGPSHEGSGSGVGSGEIYGGAPGASVDKSEPKQPQGPVITPGPGETVDGGINSNPLGHEVESEGVGNAGTIGPVVFRITNIRSQGPSGMATYDSTNVYAATTYNPSGAGIVTTQMTKEQLQQFLNLQLLRFDTQMELKRCMTTDECAVPFQEGTHGMTYEEEGIIVFVPHVYFTGAP